MPQTGTPEAIGSLLHGDFQDIPKDWGFIVSKATARGLGEYMPDGFSLLPSLAYFAAVATPVIDMTKAPLLHSAVGIASSMISNLTDLKTFLTGTGRTKPAADDTETPNVLFSTLFNAARSEHDALDTWVPPAGITIVQIAGWGIDTPAGIAYNEKKSLCFTLLCTRQLH